MDRRGIITDYLPWIILSIAVLAVIMIVIFSMKGQGASIIDSLKNLFRP